MLVFVPLAPSDLTAWAETGTYAPKAAFAVTATMRETFGFTSADDEDAEHTSLHIAGLTALLASGARLVAVVETPAKPVAGAEFGDVRVGALAWSSVTCVFGENSPQAASALQRTLTDVTFDAAWERSEVADFLADNELLWHGPGEWETITAG